MILYIAQNITKVVESKIGRIVFSIILGLGLATIFYKACNDRNCITIRAPPLKKMLNNKFKHKNSDKCHKYKAKEISCSNVDKTHNEIIYE